MMTECVAGLLLSAYTRRLLLLPGTKRWNFTVAGGAGKMRDCRESSRSARAADRIL